MNDERKVIPVDFQAKRILSEAESPTLSQRLTDGTVIMRIMPDGKKLFVVPGEDGNVFIGFPLMQVHNGEVFSYIGACMSDSDKQVFDEIISYLRDAGLVKR